MHSLLIVDGDVLVRTHIRGCYPWMQEGFMLSNDGSTGAQALALVTQHPPDVLLLDISLPDMDGLTLLGQLRETGFLGGVLVLSSREDFTSVKEAMRLGADDYLRKDTLSPETLKVALANVVAQAKARRVAAKERAHLQVLADKATRVIRRELLETLLAQELVWDKQYTETQLAGLLHQYYRTACILFSVAHAGAAQEQALAEQCLRVIAPLQGELIELGLSKFAILYDFSSEPSSMRQNSMLTKQGSALSCLSADVRVGISTVCQRGSTIARAYRQAEEALETTFYGQPVCVYDEARRLSPHLPRDCANFLHELPTAITRGDSEAITASFHKALHALENTLAHPDVVRRFFRMCDEAAELPKQEEGRYLALRALTDCDSLLLAYLMRAEEATLRDSGISPAVFRAMQYVRRHYAEPIGLGHAAREVDLTSAYLSRIFKQESGIGFNEYLIDCRMEEVRRVLETTLGVIKTIAAHAGFHDYQYFCKMFRKKYGVSPTEYRKTYLSSGGQVTP